MHKPSLSSKSSSNFSFPRIVSIFTYSNPEIRKITVFAVILHFSAKSDDSGEEESESSDADEDESEDSDEEGEGSDAEGKDVDIKLDLDAEATVGLLIFQISLFCVTFFKT